MILWMFAKLDPKFYQLVMLKRKILGSIALIDDGELDWKVIVINVHDPLFKEVNDINDLDENVQDYWIQLDNGLETIN